MVLETLMHHQLLRKESLVYTMRVLTISIERAFRCQLARSSREITERRIKGSFYWVLRSRTKKGRTRDQHLDSPPWQGLITPLLLLRIITIWVNLCRRKMLVTTLLNPHRCLIKSRRFLPLKGLKLCLFSWSIVNTAIVPLLFSQRRLLRAHISKNHLPVH